MQQTLLFRGCERYIEVQTDGETIKRVDLKYGKNVQEIQAKYKLAFEIALTNPGKFVDASTLEVFY